MKLVPKHFLNDGWGVAVYYIFWLGVFVCFMPELKDLAVALVHVVSSFGDYIAMRSVDMLRS
jgi:hypothetical protein